MAISKRKIETTTASPKGQVVIPQSLRKQLKIEPGTKFAVYGKKDTLIFKKIEMPTVEDFEKLVDFGVKFARRKGIKEEDVLKDD
ncbi:MAG: AbrB/MazE/SpoVT family DNA-binding domain-containing protein [Methanobacteriota archaeon]|nr:AbrB/MazE/SpoVT family DNA-binding domain-containing protein [Candidatus Hydrothermarchaeota archaeon]